MMIGFLYNISKDSQGPNFVCNNNIIEKKVCHASATHHHTSALVFLLTACCGVLTSVFYQWYGYCRVKPVLQESMNIQCMKQQLRSYILW
jgi:hypothetical protein